jgi:hypothetical protein
MSARTSCSAATPHSIISATDQPRAGRSAASASAIASRNAALS